MYYYYGKPETYTYRYDPWTKEHRPVTSTGGTSYYVHDVPTRPQASTDKTLTYLYGIPNRSTATTPSYVYDVSKVRPTYGQVYRTSDYAYRTPYDYSTTLYNNDNRERYVRWMPAVRDGYSNTYNPTYTHYQWV